MIPEQKVKDIISRHDSLEKDLTSGKIESKFFAQKSREYSNLKEIISIARDYLSLDTEKKDLEEILKEICFGASFLAVRSAENVLG